jgi:hydroxyethylthiazole kinase
MTSISIFSGHRAGAELQRLRAAAPLVHCLTNSVVTAFNANALLAVGAAPAMVVEPVEAAAFAAIAGALYVNVGTLSALQATSICAAVASAVVAGTPWTLDPVAVGALAWRSEFCAELLEQHPTAIRGNASEILALAGAGGGGRGVDSTADSMGALDAAQRLAARTGAVVAVTGATDYITDGDSVLSVCGGDALLQRVTGTGCSLSALVAAFNAGAGDRLAATAAACALMKLAGETAARTSLGPGSFAVALLDALASTDAAALAARWPQ